MNATDTASARDAVGSGTALLQAGGLGLPVFVLLFDMCGAARADFDVATALQRECLDEGAEDVLCNSRSAICLSGPGAVEFHRGGLL